MARRHASSTRPGERARRVVDRETAAVQVALRSLTSRCCRQRRGSAPCNSQRWRSLVHGVLLEPLQQSLSLGSATDIGGSAALASVRRRVPRR